VVAARAIVAVNRRKIVSAVFMGRNHTQSLMADFVKRFCPLALRGLLDGCVQGVARTFGHRGVEEIRG
jgi:ABC-type molybdate transport system permease subunit